MHQQDYGKDSATLTYTTDIAEAMTVNTLCVGWSLPVDAQQMLYDSLKAYGFISSAMVGLSWTRVLVKQYFLNQDM